MMNKAIYSSLYGWIGKMVLTGILFGILISPLMGQKSQQSKEQVASVGTLDQLFDTEITQDVSESSVLKKIIFLKLEETTVLDALKVIAEKGDLKLSYDTQLPVLEKKRTLNMEGMTIEEALWKALEETGLRFAISPKGQLILMKKEKEIQLQPIQETITGSVTDAQSGETLPGVNILVKRTTTGTSTDQDGNFELEAPSLQDTLVVSFIGYQTQEVPINGRTEINIEMHSQTVSGEELVVTALGIERESASLGYSVSEVKGEDFTEARSINVANSLSGRIAGVNATGMGTGPGGSSRVIIRGSGSLNGNNQPLYVVNGMPITNDSRNVATMERGGSSRVDLGDGISHINPDDIESISVLKGGGCCRTLWQPGSQWSYSYHYKTGNCEQGRSWRRNKF